MTLFTLYSHFQNISIKICQPLFVGFFIFNFCAFNSELHWIILLLFFTLLESCLHCGHGRGTPSPLSSSLILPVFEVKHGDMRLD